MRVARETWSFPQALGPKLEWPGQLVEHAGPQSRAGLARDIWLTLLGLGHGPNFPKKLVDPSVSRNRVRVVKDFWSTSWSSDPSESRLGQHVDHAGHRGRAESPGELVDTAGHRT